MKSKEVFAALIFSIHNQPSPSAMAVTEEHIELKDLETLIETVLHKK
ncbi:MAG: hypothetical protein PF904_10520 [Kiritimatiellae bacterium]|nr:hypothetical protein [Kiritimatiellia bacterium]